MALMAIGIAIGVVLVLLALTALPIMQSHIDRLAWHRTDAASPGHRARPGAVARRHRPVRGPGRHPGARRRARAAAAGAARRRTGCPARGRWSSRPRSPSCCATVPDDQLGDRFPGPDRRHHRAGRPDRARRAGGHRRPYAGADAGTHGAYEIRGIEQPGEGVDLGIFVRILVAMLAVLLIGPVVVFLAMVTRVGAARREQRFAALRLAGATRLQTAVLAATETATPAIAGVLLGWLVYVVARPVVASYVSLEGLRFPLDDLAVPAAQLAVVLVVVPLIAVASTVVALYRVQITPLGVRRRIRRRPPRATRLVPIAAGIIGIVAVDQRERAKFVSDTEGPILSLIAAASLLSILVGIVITGPWVCMWISRGLARLSRRATILLAARRIAADPYTASHAVIAVALGVFVATPIGVAAAAPQPARTVLSPGVVAIQVYGAAEENFASLMSANVVVARLGTDRTMVVPCVDLARVTTLTCPLPAEAGERGPVAALFYPSGFAEPGPNADRPIEASSFPPRHARSRGADPHGRCPNDAARADPDLPRLFR